MLGFSKVLLSAVLLYALFSSCQCGKVKDWTYSLDKITTTTNDPAKVSFDVKSNRIERGKYGMNGTMTFGMDFDDSVFVQVDAFRSNSGSGSYKPIPLKVPKCKFTEFMNKYYKKFLMKGIKDCSNFPQFDDTWNGPVPAKEYYFKDCRINQDELPDHMQDGFYKILLTLSGSGGMNGTAELIVKIETKVGL